MAAQQGSARRKVFLIDWRLQIIEDHFNLRLLIRSLFSKMTQLSNWNHTSEMSFGMPKCKNLNISSKKSLSNREYHTDGTRLTTATCSETIDLGITITGSLQWSQLIDQIFQRANHTLNKPYCQPLFGKWAHTPPPNRRLDAWVPAIVNYHKSDCCLLKSSR